MPNQLSAGLSLPCTLLCTSSTLDSGVHTGRRSVLGRTDRRQGDGVYWAGLIEDRETVYWAGLIEDWALLLCSAVNWEKCISNCRSALIQTLLQFHLFSFVLLSCTSLCKFFPECLYPRLPVRVFPVCLYPTLCCVLVSSMFVFYTSLCKFSSMFVS